MRIGVDLDGTICEIKQEHQSYSDVKPIPDAVEKLQELNRQGHEIIIMTARHMKTCLGDSSKVVARVGKIPSILVGPSYVFVFYEEICQK